MGWNMNMTRGMMQGGLVKVKEGWRVDEEQRQRGLTGVDEVNKWGAWSRGIGGSCVVFLEAWRLVACSPLHMRLITTALNQHETPAHTKCHIGNVNNKSSGGTFLSFSPFYPLLWFSVALLFLLHNCVCADSSLAGLHMISLYADRHKQHK